MAPAPQFNGHLANPVDIPDLCMKHVGVEPVLDPRFDRLHVHVGDRVQSRIDKNNAPEYMAKRYARLMSENPFPPVLVTRDGHTVDGNTRCKAHGIRNERYIPAWVLPIDWETADAETREKLLLLSLFLNSLNGLPLDEAEMSKYAETLIKSGASDEEVMGLTGLAMTKINSLRDRQRAKDRLKQLNIPEEEFTKVVGESTLRAFGKPNALRLDDEMYLGMVSLASDARLKGPQVNSLSTSLNELATVDTRRERIERERTALEAQIAAFRTGQTVPMQVQWLRKAMTHLIDPTKPITAFVEGDPEKVGEYVELLTKSVERLHEIRTQHPAATRQ